MNCNTTHYRANSSSVPGDPTLFVGSDGLDVVRALYLHLTGQPVPASTPRVGRKWMVEDQDLESTLDYFAEGSLTVREWLASLRGVEESAWFAWDDPVPFARVAGRLLGGAVGRIRKRRRPSPVGHPDSNPGDRHEPDAQEQPRRLPVRERSVPSAHA